MQRILTILIAGATLAACTQEKTPAAPDATTPDAAPAQQAQPTKTSTAALPPPTGQKYRETAVYFDGEPLAVLAFGELPPKLETMWIEIGMPKMKVRRFSFARYFRALGVDLAKVNEIHMYGGRQRTAIMKGKTVAEHEKDLLFSFTSSDTGSPRIHWPEKIAVNDEIDKVYTIALYAKKKPPVMNKDYQLVLEGEVLDAAEIPYVVKEIRGGTRVYVDGHLATIIKRNTLGALNQVEKVETSTVPRWKLDGQLQTLGVKLDETKTADLINQDLNVARVASSALKTATFRVLEKSGGMIVLEPPGKMVTVLMLYAKYPPIDLSKR